jgi:AraC-like DNA-binding protein
VGISSHRISLFIFRRRMALETVWREHPEQSLPIWHNPDEVFESGLGAGERYRLVLARKGSGILRWNGHSEAFLAPVVFCFNEREQPLLAQSIGLEAQAFYFHPQYLNGGLSFETMHTDYDRLPVPLAEERFWFRAFIDRKADSNLQIALGPANAQRMAALFDDTTRELIEQPEYWRCRARAFLLEIIFLLERLFTEARGEHTVEAFSPVPVMPGREPRILPAADSEIEQLLLYLHTHYQEKLTLTGLARAFHTNRTTLNERFHRATGEPLMTYLIRLRIRLAALMLRDTTLPVEEVMMRVGYSNLSHFGRTFRKHAGCAPTEYRQQFCWLLR